MNITNTLLFFVDKMQCDAMQRILTFYQQKNKSVFAYVVGINLTSCGLNDDVKLTKI